MSNDVKQPIAFSFQDYRNEAIVDFFANENRSFQPDISGGLSNGRLRLVGLSRLESQPTAAFRASISLTEGTKNNAANVVTNIKPLDNYPKNLNPTQKSTAKTQKITSQLKANTQLKTTKTIGAVSLIQDCNDEFESASGNVGERIEAALSKPSRSIASLTRSGKTSTNLTGKVSVSGVESCVKKNGVGIGVDGRSKSENGIKVGNLELPAVVTPELQPVLPSCDRINILKKKAADGEDVLRLVTLQVSNMQQEIADATKYKIAGNSDKFLNTLRGGHGLRIVSENSIDMPELRVVDVVDVVDQIENKNLNQDTDIAELNNGDCENNCYDNVQSSIKLDQNLQKLIKAWSWLPDQIKETIISVVTVAEKEKNKPPQYHD
ncbi:MAG: hypothetical protein LBC74_12570 [Planctomycetaceae bacterium]|jgi:hypothetical protein|nr:hypothetical protein [Planctomycetaceae bacterium]